MVVETIRTIIEMIPTAIAWVRDFIIGLSDKLNLPSESTMLAFILIALVISYYWIKQWITYSVFTKVSTLLNWLLLALLVYLLLAYV